MEVVLLEQIENLGSLGDVVNVRPGHARNFLLPQGKALRATKANIARFEREREALEKLNDERKAEAQSRGEKLDGETFVLIRQAGDTGQLYGSVSSRDVAEAAAEAGFSVTRGQVRLDTPIKTIGVYEIRISLHAEVYVTVEVNVARSKDEAERQAKGEDVVASARDEDRAAAIAERTGLSEEDALRLVEEGGDIDLAALAEGSEEGSEEGSGETSEEDAVTAESEDDETK